jgi:hypothetical protein
MAKINPEEVGEMDNVKTKVLIMGKLLFTESQDKTSSGQAGYRPGIGAKK